MRSLRLITAIGLCLFAVPACSISRAISEPAASTPRTANAEGSRPSTDRLDPAEQSKIDFGDVPAANNGTVDQLHIPPKGSSERQAIMDALRDAYNDRRSPAYEAHHGELTFVVNFLKVHNGWSWVFADPHSTDPKDSFGENNGFLLHEENGRWRVMTLPPMVDDPDDPENLDYPTMKDVGKIKQKFPSVPTDIFPKAS